MPQGCDFTCKTAGCVACDSVITLHGVWPTKNIDDAISDSEDKDIIAALKGRKNAGRTTALFVYPDDIKRTPCGYRVQVYCPSCLVVEDVDCNKEDAIAFSDNPPACHRCGGLRLSLKKAVEIGIECPHCHGSLIPNYWFTKSSDA